MTVQTPSAARVVVRGGKRWWLCPNCDHTLGELVGVRLVVVIRGRRFTFELVPRLRQTCPSCGHESVYSG
jgi:ribosomal protein L37AE/L43A